VTAENDPEHPYEANVPSNAWLQVLNKVNDAKKTGKRKVQVFVLEYVLIVI